MALTVKNILDRVQFTLQDTTNIRWTQTELLNYLNDAQREIALLKPDATSINTNIQLATGTQQSLPDGGNRILRVLRNMSSAAGDATGGRAIRQVSLESLDAQDPNWHDPTATGLSKHTTIVKHWVYDEMDPKTFYVYPGVAGNAFVEIVYSVVPGILDYSSSGSSTLGVNDIYGNAIINFILYKAYVKDSENAANQNKATGHYSLFLNTVGQKSQLDLAINPVDNKQVG
jgi:hypothetical protein